MRKMNKKVTSLTLTLTLCIIASQSAFAAWSAFGTFDVGNSETYYTSSGTMLGQKKGTTYTNFFVHASAKTMTSSPSVRLVSDSGASRSSYVSIPDTGYDYEGYNNTGASGSTYYASVKPAWNQVGADSIRLQHDPR